MQSGTHKSPTRAGNDPIFAVPSTAKSSFYSEGVVPCPGGVCTCRRRTGSAPDVRRKFRRRRRPPSRLRRKPDRMTFARAMDGAAQPVRSFGALRPNTLSPVLVYQHLLWLLRRVETGHSEFSNWKQGELLPSLFVSQCKRLYAEPTRLTFGHPASRTGNGEHSTLVSGRRRYEYARGVTLFRH